MEHSLLLGPSAVRVAGFRVRALEDQSRDEQHLETWDELEQEVFGWTRAERLDTKPDPEGFSTRNVAVELSVVGA